MIAQAVIDDLMFVSRPRRCREGTDSSHRAVPRRRLSPSRKSAWSLQALQLALIHARMVVDDVIMSRQEEPACPARRIADQVMSGSGRMTSTMAWIKGRGSEVLSGAGLHVLGVTFQQGLVGIALDVGAQTTASLSLSMSSLMSRVSMAGSWILFWALLKMTPSVPGSLPRVSRVRR